MRLAIGACAAGAATMAVLRAAVGGSGTAAAAPPALVVVQAKAELVSVPAGAFTMGATDDQIAAQISECQAAIGPNGPCATLFDDERPARRVYLDPFAIDRTEVTRAAYLECVLDGACQPGPLAFPAGSGDRPRAPITFVTWQDAADYCAFRKERLPSEAEWEKAARGDAGAEWPWGDGMRLRAFNHGMARLRSLADIPFDDSDGALLAADVASFPEDRSPYGALDMAGNVREWVADWYGAPDGEDLVNPHGPRLGEERVVRGAGFESLPLDGRGERRWHEPPRTRLSDVGFRCVRLPEGTAGNLAGGW